MWRCGSRASVILAARNPRSRIAPSMLFVGFVVAALGAWMMTVATKQLSRVNEGHRLPMIIGRFAVRPPVRGHSASSGSSDCSPTRNADCLERDVELHRTLAFDHCRCYDTDCTSCHSSHRHNLGPQSTPPAPGR